MQPKTFARLKDFEKRFCSFFIPDRDPIMMQIEEVSLDGVWGFGREGTMIFLQWEHIQGFQEAITLDAKNPEHAELIKDMQREAEAEPTTDHEKQTFVDVRHIKQLARETKASVDRFDAERSRLSIAPGSRSG